VTTRGPSRDPALQAGRDRPKWKSRSSRSGRETSPAYRDWRRSRPERTKYSTPPDLAAEEPAAREFQPDHLRGIQ
jgi:hypothetical protein